MEKTSTSGCLIRIFVIFISVTFSTITKELFGIQIPLLAPVAVVVIIISILELRKRRRDMESHLGRKIKGDHELVSLSSWMEVSQEKDNSKQKTQTEKNQRVFSPVKTSTEDRNPDNTPIINRTAKKQDEKLKEKPLGTPIKDFDRQTQIQMRENLTSLLETARTKGKDALKEEVGKLMRSKNEDHDDQTIDQSLELGNPLEPRIYHYLFAHKYIPDKLSENLQGVISWITGEKGIEHLRTRWTLLPTVYNLEPKDFIEPIGINRYVLNPTNKHTIVLVQFPKPERVSEAFFSAIVINPDNSYRYFTLERTFEEYDSNAPQTILGEWKNSNHTNLGSGSFPSIEDFSALIIEKFL